MNPLADPHVHLLAGLDDGPRTWDDALAMCRVAAADGVRHATALAHQSERWPLTPADIRAAADELARRVFAAAVPLEVVPAAEVMAAPDLWDGWRAGRFLSVGDHRKHLLVEMPHRVFVDLRADVRRFAARGVHVILAHPERHPELLHDPGRLEELIALGCLVQVNAGSVTDPPTPADAKALRGWFRRGCVHLVGSDGHSPRKRPPVMAAARDRIAAWAGDEVAETVCGANGRAVLRGEDVRAETPEPERRWWPLRLLG
jgi:protein-tyrosine phosphatase